MAREDLIPFNEMTEEQQKKIASKGGKASQEARKRRKTLKEELQVLLEMADEQGNTPQKKMSFAMIKEAVNGNVRAFETIRDTIGQKPIDKVENTFKDNGPVEELVNSIKNIKQ